MPGFGHFPSPVAVRAHRTRFLTGHNGKRPCSRVCSPRYLPWIAAGLVLCMGVACAVGLCIWLYKTDTNNFYRIIENQCRRQGRLLETTFNNKAVQMVSYFAAFLHAAPNITTETVDKFGNRSTFDSNLFFSMYGVVVFPRENLDDYQHRYNMTVWPKVNATDADPEIAVITQNYPSSLLSRVLGFNTLSDPIRRQAMLKSIRNITIAVSRPILIIANRKPGVNIYLPVAPRKDWQQGERWVAGAVVQLDMVFQHSLINDPNQIALQVVNDQGASLYSTDPTSFAEHPEHSHLDVNAPMTVLTEKWTVTCRANPDYKESLMTPWPWVLLATQLVTFAILAELTRRGIVNYFNATSVLIQYRHQEEMLNTLKQYSTAITDAIPSCLATVDSEGRILGMNAKGIHLTGYTLAELESIPMSEVLQVPVSISGLEVVDPSSVQGSQAGFFPEGHFEGLVRRKNGTTFPARVTIVSHHAFSQADRAPQFGSPPALESISGGGASASGDTESLVRPPDFAQVILFTDISNYIALIKSRDDAERRTRDAWNLQRDLLRFIVVALQRPLRQILEGIKLLQAKANEQTAATSSPPASPSSIPPLIATPSPPPPMLASASAPGIQKKRSRHSTVGSDSRSPVMIQDAHISLRHMQGVVEDVGWFVGRDVCLHADSLDGDCSDSCGNKPARRSLRDMLSIELDEWAPLVREKQLATTSLVYPPDVELEGDLSAIRMIISRMVCFGAVGSCDRATWNHRYEITDHPLFHPSTCGGSLVNLEQSLQSAASRLRHRRAGLTRLYSASPSESTPGIAPAAEPFSDYARGTIRTVSNAASERLSQQADTAPSSSPATPVTPARVAPINWLIVRQEISQVRQGYTFLDSDELCLDHMSLGSQFGNLALSFVGMQRFAQRHGGGVRRWMGPDGFSRGIELQLPLNNVSVIMNSPS